MLSTYFSGIFSSRFSPKDLYEFIISAIYVTCHTLLIALDFIAIMILVKSENYKSADYACFLPLFLYIENLIGILYMYISHHK